MTFTCVDLQTTSSSAVPSKHSLVPSRPIVLPLPVLTPNHQCASNTVRPRPNSFQSVKRKWCLKREERRIQQVNHHFRLGTKMEALTYYKTQDVKNLHVILRILRNVLMLGELSAKSKLFAQTGPPAALLCNVFSQKPETWVLNQGQRLTCLFLSPCFVRQHCDFLWSMSTGGADQDGTYLAHKSWRFHGQRWVKRQFIKVQVMIRALAWNGRLDLP